ncbi:MAG: hypothetical protein ACLTBV_21785 [Enterocloster bolteae]
MLLFTAALSRMPSELSEAASVDGAGSIRQLLTYHSTAFAPNHSDDRNYHDRGFPAGL